MQNFPILSIITLLPFVVALIIFLMPRSRGENAKMLGLMTMIVNLILSLALYVDYNRTIVPNITDGMSWSERLAYVEEYSWFESAGISYIMGVDGLSLTLILLTSIIGLGAVFVSWSIDDRVRDFYGFLMLLLTGIFGALSAVDGFLLFFFYELAVLPMFLMIAIWGWKKRSQYAAMKLTLYKLIGSLVALVPFIMIYLETKTAAGLANPTFDLRVWSQVAFDVDMQKLLFMPIFLGFAVAASIFPLHNWLPDGHVAAPTAISMILAGILMKLGAYIAMRIGIQMLPDGAVFWMPLVMLLGVIGVIYGAFLALRQRDVKYMVAYSSISHMGLVFMGLAAMNDLGLEGAGIQMVSHGILTALLFACIGMLYDRTHTRDMDQLSGLIKVMPWVAVAFIIGGLASMGMPGLSGFVGEFPIFMGAWSGGDLNYTGSVLGLNPATFYYIAAEVAVIGIIITAAYILRAVSSVFFGEYDESAWHDMRPIMAIDKIVLVMFSALLFIIGLFPQVISPIVNSGIQPVVDRIQEAQTPYMAEATQTILDVILQLF